VCRQYRSYLETEPSFSGDFRCLGRGYPAGVVSLPDHLKPAPVGKARLAGEVVEGHQRDRVLASAAPVFAERGFNATTVDDLVAAARIGVGSFYSLFDGKLECFLLLYDRLAAEARARVVAAVPEDALWPTGLCAGLRELLALVAADPDGARVVLVEAVTAGPQGEARYSESLKEVVAALRGGRALDPRRGESLPASLESATVAGLAWLLHRRLTDGEGAEVEELFPEMARVVLEPFVGEAAARTAIDAALVPAEFL
jgi:AcrR family transcriptional regulator